MRASTDDLKVLLTALLQSSHMTLKEAFMQMSRTGKIRATTLNPLEKAYMQTLTKMYSHKELGQRTRRGWLTESTEKFSADLKTGLSKTTLGLIDEILEKNIQLPIK